MKFYIIAGEASGDLHAGNLVKALKNTYGSATFRGLGGDQMAAQGVEIIKHFKDLAFMGFVEVLTNLRTIIRNISACKKDILSFKPDVVILIDYPGFNLRIASFLKKKGIRCVYYISPQVWAWKQNRVHQIKRDIDLMLVILPFEEKFYQKFGMNVHFVGHPLLDLPAFHRESNQFSSKDWKNSLRTDKRIMALLPGSRKQEIDKMLPVMLSMKKHYPDFTFVVAAASHIPLSIYEEACTGLAGVAIVYDHFYEILSEAHIAMVTSGTATLETALMKVPEIVCYKGNFISYLIARKLVKVPFISLVNLIADKEVVKELIQDEFNEVNLKAQIDLLMDEDVRKKIDYEYDVLRIKLGKNGASEKAANYIIDFLNR